MRIRSGVYWSKGAGHGKNQDSLSLQHVLLRTGECLFAIVCDGIGSLPYSEEASGYAVRRMTDWFYHEGKELICPGRSKELILLALQKQCCRMQEELVRFQRMRGIQTGTTCSAVLLHNRRYYLIHIGDSRIYRIRKSKFPIGTQFYYVRSMTKAHTDSQGRLLRCLGMDGGDRAVIETGRLAKGTGLLLCTDGFCYGEEKTLRKKIGQALGPLIGSGGRFRGGVGGRQGRGKKHTDGDRGIDRRLEVLGEQAKAAGGRDDMAAAGILVT